MSLVDKPFKDALKNLPAKKLSWSADRRIRGMIRQRAAELDGKMPFWKTFQRLIAAPVALAIVVVSTGGYAYASPGVIQGDLLYPVKSELEDFLYPENGSSEDRVAYHLWLSERRYAEVEEILKRRSQAIPLASLAFAQEEEGNLYDDILLQTLEKATQHVEYAFLVSDEVRDLDRVESIQSQIRESLQKQKVVLDEITPVLKEVKLKRKRKARVARVPKVQNLESTTQIQDPNAQKPETSDQKPETLSAPLKAGNGQGESTPLALDDRPATSNQEVFSSSLKSDKVENQQMNESENDDEIDDMAEFIMDRLAFQQVLLDDVEEKVQQAKVKKTAKLELGVDKVFDGVATNDVVVDKLFSKALENHYQKKQKVIQDELEEIDKELVALEVLPVIDDEGQGENDDQISDPNDKEPVTLSTSLKAGNDQGESTPSALDDRPSTSNQESSDEEPEVDNQDPQTSEPETSEPETSEPETSESETSEPETSEPETSDQEPETSEQDTSDQKEKVQEPGSNEPSAVDHRPSLEEPSEDGEVRSDQETSEPDSSEPIDQIARKASLKELCIEKSKAFCSSFGQQKCLEALQQKCNELKKESDLEALLQQAKNRLEKSQEQHVDSVQLKQRMFEKQIELKQLDEKIDILQRSKSLLNAAPENLRGDVRPHIRAEIR